MKPVVWNVRILPEGRWHLGALVRRTYALESGRRLVLAREQPEPTGEEATAWKPATDVVIRGAVVPAVGTAREALALVEIGPHRRAIRAMGDRVIEDVFGGVPVLSDPVPFEAMPFVFERCYGGFDRGGHERAGRSMLQSSTALDDEVEYQSPFTYPRNRRGTGFYVATDDPGRLRGARVPNLDDPEDPVTPVRLVRKSTADWVDAPRPVALDWVEVTDFPRSAHWGVSPDPILRRSEFFELEKGLVRPEELLPGRSFPTVPSVSALAGTPWGMLGARLRGGEDLRIDQMHRVWPNVRAQLPNEPPAIRIQPPGCPWFDLEPQLDTVVLDLDEERLAMVWSAKLEVAGRYPEDELAQVVAEVEWP